MSSDDARGKLIEDARKMLRDFDYASGLNRREESAEIATGFLVMYGASLVNALSSPPAGAQGERVWWCGWSQDAREADAFSVGSEAKIAHGECPVCDAAKAHGCGWKYLSSSPAPVASYPGAWRCGETGMVWHLAETYCKHRNTAHAEVHGCGFVKLVPSSHPAPVASGIGEALEFYADPESWLTPLSSRPWSSPVEKDKGSRARSALKLLGARPEKALPLSGPRGM